MEGQNRPRGRGRRLISKELFGNPHSGWCGKDARFPLRYTPRRISVALPPRDPIGVRPHASVIASNRSRKGIYVLCPPGTCAFLGAFLLRPEILVRVSWRHSAVQFSSTRAGGKSVACAGSASAHAPHIRKPSDACSPVRVGVNAHHAGAAACNVGTPHSRRFLGAFASFLFSASSKFKSPLESCHSRLSCLERKGIVRRHERGHADNFASNEAQFES